MNYITIAGHLGSDPKTSFTPSGKKVVSFSVACKARKNGADATMWWRVTIWGETFDRILPYFKKGSSIIVNGEMMPPDVYQNRDGVTQVSLEITANHISFSPFGKGKSEGTTSAAPAAAGQSFAPSNEAFAGAPSGMEVSDEEIPF